MIKCLVGCFVYGRCLKNVVVIGCGDFSFYGRGSEVYVSWITFGIVKKDCFRFGKVDGGFWISDLIENFLVVLGYFFL